MLYSTNILDLLLLNLPTAIFWKDNNLKYLGCNKIFANDCQLGHPSKVVGLTDFDIFNEERAEQNILKDKEVLISGEPVINYEEISINADGTKDWLRKSKIPVKDKKGRIIAILGMYEKITDKKEIEEELKTEQKYLQMLMDNIPDTIYFKDRQSSFTKINQAQANFLGVESPEDAVGKSDFNFFNKAHSKKAFEDEQKLFESGIPVINKLEKLKSYGDYRYVTATKIPLQNEEGETIGLVGISRDVTKEKQFEIKLQEETDLLNALIENTPDLIYFKDKNLNYTKINKAQARMLGVKNPDDAIGKTCWSYIPDMEEYHINKEEKKVIDTGKPLINKIHSPFFMKKYKIWLSTTLIPLKDKKGIVIGIIGISRDITQQIKMQNIIQEERDLMQTLMDNIPDTIYFKDIKSRFTKINKAQATTLGLNTPEEAIGKTDFDFFPEIQARQAFSDEQIIFETGVPLINKIEKVKKADGSECWFSATKIPFRDDSGKIIGMVGISRDVSHQEMAKKSLEYAKNKAEEANKAKSQFLANMSHDIRTPMNGVIGMADILKRTNLTDEQQGYLDIIIKSGNNLLAIINDILDFSKIESGNMELESIPINIRNIVEDVADVLVIAAANKGINLVTYIDHNIPEIVDGDEIRLKQILVNLVNNAIKFTKKGEIFISTELIQITDDSCEILFKVKDTGIGISMKDQKKLFKSFSQVDASTTRKFGGTGLGLAISKKLAEQMKGKIGVKSEEDKGSLFWVTAKFSKSKVLTKKISFKKETFNNLNILIVDDNKTNRLIFKKYIEIWKCKSEEAVNGEKAFQIIEQRAKEGIHYDLALIDYQMAEMDGLEFARLAKDNPHLQKTKLILLSSVSDIIPKNKEKEFGFDGYLNKPVKLNQLYNSISMIQGKVLPERIQVTQKDPELFKNKNLRILIAEDNEINLKVAELSVKMVTSNIDSAVNGKDALELFYKNKYDVILMDVQMPKMNGYEATKKIRKFEETNKISSPVKIIAMTANAMKEDKEYCLQIGMDAHLIKPFKLGDFVEILKSMYDL